jgi:hypothetical protein
MDFSFHASSLCTISRVLVEIVLIQVLLDSMDFMVGHIIHSWTLYYSHIQFRCDRCHIYGHITTTCSHSFTRRIWRENIEDLKGDKEVQRKEDLVTFQENVVHKFEGALEVIISIGQVVGGYYIYRPGCWRLLYLQARLLFLLELLRVSK